MFVVMGVSGCGKSTVGQRLAGAMGAEFLEGDDFHPAHNVARMAAGVALTDADRQDWLVTLAERLSHARAGGQAVVLSCSALKRRYRDQLRAAAPGLMFIHLHGAPELIAARLAQRSDHYMPPSLLASQLADLEVPAPDEHAVTLDATWPVDEIVQAAIEHVAHFSHLEGNPPP